MNSLSLPAASKYVRMGNDWRTTYREVLDSLNVADYARSIGRPYRTIQDWRLGRRNPPPEALTELVAFLRSKSQAYGTAAQRLEAVAPGQDRGDYE